VLDHHLVGEALLAGMSDALREETHAAIADAMERAADAAARDPATLDGALCVDLVGHFLRGGTSARARRYLGRAVAHADTGARREDLIRLADLALAAPGLVAGAERCELLLR